MTKSVAEPLTPQQQPLLQASDITYLGAITAPATLGSGPAGLAVQGDRMFYGQGPSYFELTLPPLGGTATIVNQVQLPRAYLLGTDNPVLCGGILPCGTDRRVVTAFNYYDASGKVSHSHWMVQDDGTVLGPFPMATPATAGLDRGWINDGLRAGMVAGFMAPIPAEWQSLFGGPALTGQCCIPIIWRSSSGPSASVFDPAHVGSQTPIPSTMLVGYPSKRETLGIYDGGPNGEVGPWYSGPDQYGGVAFPAGTRTVLFVHRRAASMCYGPGTRDISLHRTKHPTWTIQNPKIWCYDGADNQDQGGHGPLYTPTVTAYDANELLAVKEGTKKPWEVLPYAAWPLPQFPIGTMAAPEQNMIRGAYFDPDTRRLYVGQTGSKVIRVYEIAAKNQPPGPVNCEETPGEWGPGPKSNDGWTVWEPSGSNTETRRRERTWTQVVAAKHGGIACVWSAADGTPGFERVFETRDVTPPPSVITATVTSSNEASAPVGATVTISVQR